MTELPNEESEPAPTPVLVGGMEAGRAIEITVFSPVRSWTQRSAPEPPLCRGGIPLPPWLVFLALRAVPELGFKIPRLSFIHFARWLVIRKFPDYGQPADSLNQSLLMFESNYNGGFDNYIDGFAYVLGGGMSKIWGTSYGFPGPRPVVKFQKYIKANQYRASHYYSAYPQAAATMITSAFAVKNIIEEFTQRAAGFQPPEFADAYRKLLVKIQEAETPVLDWVDTSTLPNTSKTLRRIRQGISFVRRNAPGLLRRVFCSNRNGRSYAITILTPICPDDLDSLNEHLRELDPDSSPLARLHNVHFGRWVVVGPLTSGWQGIPVPPPTLNSAYLLFTACVTASRPKSFLEQLTATIPDTVDGLWGNCRRYPAGGAAGAPGDVVDYLKNGLVRTSMFYAAYPNVTPAQVNTALAGHTAFNNFVLSNQGNPDPAALKNAYGEEAPNWFI